MTVEQTFVKEAFELLNKRIQTQIKYVKSGSQGDSIDEVTMAYIERVGRIKEAEEIGEELANLCNACFSINVKFNVG